MNTHMTEPAVLVLEDATIFRGQSFGARGVTLGEAVFCTGMTGYQETLTDPSYCGQIVVATAPHIGNTGWNREDNESIGSNDNAVQAPIWVAGYAVRDPSRIVSNWRATASLEDQLKDQNIVSIASIDTRTLVRHLRNFGSMKAGIFSGASLYESLGLSRTEVEHKLWQSPSNADISPLVQRVQDQPAMKGASLAHQVSTGQEYVIEPQGGSALYDVVAIDLGIKTNTPRMFAQRGVRVHVVPDTVTFDDIQALNPDGVFLSNGPGDPATADQPVELTKHLLGAGYPLFGICFGNQILGRALGLGTYKMKFGHRGINIPVVEQATGKIAITAQNHGFALQATPGEIFDTQFGRAEVSHVCANDNTVEGVCLQDGSAFSVQYHPEAAAGPHDAVYLFDRFLTQLASRNSHQ